MKEPGCEGTGVLRRPGVTAAAVPGMAESGKAALAVLSVLPRAAG